MRWNGLDPAIQIQIKQQRATRLTHLPTHTPTSTPVRTDTTCPIITLKPRFNYSVETNIVVRRRVTIVGRPLGLPTIDAHNASRAFLIEGSGALDIRFCRIIKVSVALVCV